MMMQGIRKAAENWLGKLVLILMFGFLIVSFAIWGIGDIFRGGARTMAAKVGSVEISQEALRAAYQNELQRLSRQSRRNITPDMARAAGIDQQVLSRLVTEASFDQAARKMGVAVSDATVAEAIYRNPDFKGANGAFDRNRFNDLLRNAGFNEQIFVREERGTMQRQQFAELISGGLGTPLAIQLAAHRYRTEQRSIDYVTLPASAAGEVAAPEAAVLQKYFEERKASFRAPEYRSANALVVTAEALADPAKVSDEDARKRYEEVKGQRFGAPERRTIQQIVFPNAAEARAALDRLRAGMGFEALASERNIAEKDLTLGTFAKAAIFDKAVAEAAFALEQGAVSEVVQGAFGSVLLRVTAIEAGQTRPFEEVAAEVKREIATGRAKDALLDAYDKVEDQRAGARPLAEIAKDRSMAIRAIGPVDARLALKAGGQLADIPSAQELLDAVFRSEIGADNEPLRLKDGGYIWFDVTAIEPARDRAFDEVKATVEAQWRADETATRLSAKTRELAARLDKGEEFEKVATEAGVVVASARDLTRQSTSPATPANVVAAVFGTPVGKTGTAELPGGAGRVLFRVANATVPPFLRTTKEAEDVANGIASAIADDLMLEYAAKLQKELGVTVDPQGVRNAIGGDG